MNPDERLREAAGRVEAETSRIPIPTPPTEGRRTGPALAFGLGALLTLTVIGVAVVLFQRDTTSEVVGDPSPSTTVPDPLAGTSQYHGTVTVIDTGDNPVICAGGVLASLPPQCSGPVLRNLDWADVPWAETAQGVTWADMTIDVHFNGNELTLLVPPRPAQWPDGEATDFTPPCDPPPGGWVWAEGPRTTPEHMDDAISHINSQPDLSAVWVYSLMDDPEIADQTGRQEYVIVALFTGELERHRAEIVEIWGGPLCVALGTTNAAELQRLHDQIAQMVVAGEVPGVVGYGSSYPDERRGVVVLGALIFTDQASEWFDQHYEPGVVELEATLQPVEQAG